jgi:hypothetical protein
VATHMVDGTIELPLTCGAGHDAVLCAVLAEHSGWDVSVRYDGHIVEHKHCSDWHRVERLCTQIEANRTTHGDQRCQLTDSPQNQAA